MARIPKKKKREQRWLTKETKTFAFHNGAGCEPYWIKCEGCGRISPGGEQYHNRLLQVTPCAACSNETALYEPQLR